MTQLRESLLIDGLAAIPYAVRDILDEAGYRRHTLPAGVPLAPEQTLAGRAHTPRAEQATCDDAGVSLAPFRKVPGHVSHGSVLVDGFADAIDMVKRADHPTAKDWWELTNPRQQRLAGLEDGA